MFPATQWTDLARATLHGDREGRAALEALCRTYWEPVRRVILQKVWVGEEAEDLTQSFFLYFMERGVLHKADRDRGRFRTFLQVVLGRWLMDQREMRMTAKRGGGLVPEPLGEAMEHCAELAAGFNAAEQETAFDRHWARAVMKAALHALRMECEARRGEQVFAILAPFLGAEGELATYEEAAAKLGVTVAVFKSDILRWRRKLREFLRAEIMRTVCAPHEIDEEMSYLRCHLMA